jgi:hypothetical protein
MRVARICAGCNGFVKPGDAPCPTCHGGPARKNDKQTIMVDGPSLQATDEPSWPVDPSDPMKRRICPNKAAWKERIRRSNGRLEDVS